MHRRAAILLGVAALLTVTLAGTAQASAPRVTQGDARAIFQAFGNGGWAVVLNGEAQDEAAPADFLTDSSARISPMAQWHGRHFCELDWHVISVAVNEGNPIGGTRTIKDILDTLDGVTIVIRLDGAVIETERSANKRTNNPERIGAEEAFYVDVGRIMAPEDLAAGAHTLQFTGQRPGRPPNVMPQITIHVDSAGTGACL